MKTYTLSGADASTHKPTHPERTARKYHTGMNFDVTFQVWPNRESMAKTIRLQEKSHARKTGDWIACVPLKDGEGHKQ